MSLFVIGRRFYSPYRYSVVKSSRRLNRRVFGKNSSIRGFKRYYLGRYKGGF